jgi:hypothetical protein
MKRKLAFYYAAGCDGGPTNVATDCRLLLRVNSVAIRGQRTCSDRRGHADATRMTHADMSGSELVPCKLTAEPRFAGRKSLL